MTDVADIIQYYDCHLHLKTPDDAGFDALIVHLDSQPGLVGANLIVNTAEELSVVERRQVELPARIQVIPYWNAQTSFADKGWFKIHPSLHQVTVGRIPHLIDEIAAQSGVRGLVVHAYPWGPSLEYAVCLPLVIGLAQAFPQMPVLATHGGGYRTWEFRAHTGQLPNVFYDFSVTMAYYRNADLLRPFGIYAQSKPDRLVFGSDWPSADPQDQLESSRRIAAEYSVSAASLYSKLLSNSMRLWPGVAELN